MGSVPEEYDNGLGVNIDTDGDEYIVTMSFQEIENLINNALQIRNALARELYLKLVEQNLMHSDYEKFAIRAYTMADTFLDIGIEHGHSIDIETLLDTLAVLKQETGEYLRDSQYVDIESEMEQALQEKLNSTPHTPPHIDDIDADFTGDEQ